jgi:arylsulfatase A-like enzyme
MNSHRRQLLKAAAAGLAGAPAFLSQRQRRPNVLLILADEWRAQAAGYNGDSNVRTPVLDRLESESVHFENAVSGCPVCCPYRASLLTGQHPLTHGVFINDVELKPKGPTLSESYRRAGYRTGIPLRALGAHS